jgi:hypothetical protein
VHDTKNDGARCACVERRCTADDSKRSGAQVEHTHRNRVHFAVDAPRRNLLFLAPLYGFPSIWWHVVILGQIASAASKDSRSIDACIAWDRF